MNIRIVETPADILSCYGIMKQLRPDLVEPNFVADIRRKQTTGYVLAALSDPDVCTVAGFREKDMFGTGRILYVDDLVTDAGRRSGGYGRMMLDWLKAEALRRNCRYLNLDSGCKRVDAHRFYQTHGMAIVAFHFSIPIGDTPHWAPSDLTS